MTIQQIMTAPAVTCTPETTLGAAARLMRETDCGTLPVIGADGRLVGILTDRDVCLTIATSNRNPGHIAVHEAMTPKVFTALVNDSVHDALATMKAHRVRRLPVLDASGRLKGLVSIEDIVVRGLETGGIGTDEIVLALKTLYERRPAPIEIE